MSVTNPAGEKLDLLQDPDTFRHHLESEWASANPHRWKQLAILTLIGNGWNIPNIAAALGLHKGHVYRVANQARESIAEFANPTPANAA